LSPNSARIEKDVKTPYWID